MNENIEVGRIVVQMARKRTSEPELLVSSAAAAAPAPVRLSPAKTHTKRSTRPAGKVSASKSTPQESGAVYEPSHEAIAELAYLYWEARGCQGGSPEEDWLRAQQELRARQTALSA